MKKMLRIGFCVVLITIVTSLPSIAEEREPAKRGVGPANFYLSIKDKIGITKEQEEKLMTLEKDAIKKLDAITPSLMKAQQSLSAATKEDNVDLKKTRELLNSMANLETDRKFIVIEALVLENKVLKKEQLEKAKEIVREMSKGPHQTLPPPPAVK